MCDDSFDLSPGIDSDADLKSRRTKLKRGKRLSELNRLRNALLCIKTEVFEQDNVISGILLTGSWHDACSVRDAIVFPLFQRLRVDGRKRFEYATYGRLFFRKQTEKISVLKNIRIRVNGTSVWTLFLWFLCGNFPYNKLRLLFILKHFFYSGCYPLFSLMLHYPFFA